MSFRIAIGQCNCQAPYRNGTEEFVCKAIHERLDIWRSCLPAEIGGIPIESFEEQLVDGHHVTFGTFRVGISTDKTLVVFQALVHTWSRPTFLSLGAVGRMYAEGLLITSDGRVEIAPNELMWQFR
jgi:hypothetical protein